MDLRSLPVVKASAPSRTRQKSEASSGSSDSDSHSTDSDDDILGGKKPEKKQSSTAAKDNGDLDLR